MQFLSSSQAFHPGLCTSNHQDWPTFQDYTFSRGKPNNVARSSQKLSCEWNIFNWDQYMTRKALKYKYVAYHEYLSTLKDKLLSTERSLQNQSMGKILEGGCSSYNRRKPFWEKNMFPLCFFLLLVKIHLVTSYTGYQQCESFDLWSTWATTCSKPLPRKIHHSLNYVDPNFLEAPTSNSFFRYHQKEATTPQGIHHFPQWRHEPSNSCGPHFIHF